MKRGVRFSCPSYAFKAITKPNNSTTMLRLTLVQSSLIWEDKIANLQQFTERLQGLQGHTDLIVLPEMFTTGFSMNAKPLAEKMDGASIEWMAQQAKKLEAVVTGSLIIEEDGNFYNRLIWMRPDGSFEHYDKRHLFTLAKEDQTYAPGTKKLIVEYKGWRICPLVCYDLRFPVWSRNVENYDLLLYVANWPDKRSQAWRSLLIARAIENQAYVIGVNRVGADENGHQYRGDSMAVDYAGDVLLQTSNVENCSTIRLEYNSMEVFRQKLAFLADRDDFSINL